MTETLALPDLALDAIRRYPDADNPSSFLAVNEGNAHLRLPDTPGVIVYRPAGRYLVQFGGPFAPAEARPRLLRAFLDLAAEQRREIVAIQLQGADAAGYLDEGFTVNQIGGSYALRLDDFSLRGTAFMQLRNKIARAVRSGMTISEAPLDAWHDRMRTLDTAWLGSKGGARPLEFLVGEYGGPYQHLRRLFVGVHGDQLTGYISYSPVYGSRPGWMHDLSRRRPDSPPGVMEAINKAAIETFQAEGAEWLHFGYTPFSGLSAEHELPGHSRAFQWFMKELWTNGGHIYPAQTQYAYKEKWKQDVVLPEYIAFQGEASIPALVHVFRACNAV
ncbi:DUF2156 domain-containing protein [Spirillospora sp. NPDC047279]|uniref:bifunctional lysylphosphatidylglycerol flippase/synthetase MprF n=1 Tax=Spirillospora sp. NPDC047279 TaxID=3155478 RepID=UPI0033E51809